MSTQAETLTLTLALLGLLLVTSAAFPMLAQ